MIDRTGYEHLLPQPTQGVVTTTVIAEREVGPDPYSLPQAVISLDPRLDLPKMRTDIIPVPVYEREGGAFFSNWGKADARGNTIAGACTGLVENNNITWAEFRYAPTGQPLAPEVRWRIDPVWKIDDMTCWPAVRADNPNMADLIVFLTTHTIGLPTRRIVWEFAVIENCYHYSAAAELTSEGGPGAYRGIAIPEGEPVDYEEVQRRAKMALDEWLDSWIADGESTRQTLKNMVADSTLHLMRPAVDGDPNRWKVVEWNDRTFDREKNAAANPLANVLGGLDDWGVARRDELKQIIREVLQEIDEPDVEG